MKLKTQVIIDPVVNIYYASFYIEGFYKKYGKGNVKFQSKPFRDLSLASRMEALIFIVKEKNKIRKYVISLLDAYTINDELYNWSDVYGSVNANITLTPEKYRKKLISLAPSFGIRLYNPFYTLYYALTNLFKGIISTKESFSYRKFLGKYTRMFSLRLPYQLYENQPKHTTKDIPYIFHLSTLWYNDEWNKNDEGVNKTRANFIRACKQIKDILFEGGMVSQGIEKSSEELFKDCLYPNTISMKIWMKKTLKSNIVFNTPAFWNCHGWKLGEYLALGKAIISTSLSNDLPEPLKHGENIHFVKNDEDSIKDAIKLIISDNKYRTKLEKGALAYWEKYGNPVNSLKLLGII